MIIDRYFPIWGGAENQLRQLIPHLQNLGCKIMILTRRWDKSMSEHELVENIPVIRVGWPGNNIFSTLSYLGALTWYTFHNKKSFDIIHTHGAAALGAVGHILGWLNKKANVAKVASADRIPILEKNVLGRIVLAIFRRSDAVICLSDEIHDQLKRIYVPKDRIWMIFNAVNGNKFHPYPREKYELFRDKRGLNRNDPVVIFSGNFRRRKGLDILIDAWPIIIKAHQTAHLFILGSGKFKPDSLEDQLFRIVKENNIANIHFEGDVARPEEYLGVGDILVLPSRSRTEGMPNCLLEAMASGLASASSDIDGVAGIIKNLETGILFPPEDANGLAAAVIRLLNDATLRRDIGQRAREFALKNFSFTEIAKQYFSLYIDLYKTS